MRFLKKTLVSKKKKSFSTPFDEQAFPICLIFYGQLAITRQRSMLVIPPVRRSSLILNPYIKSALDSNRDKKMHESRTDIVQDETGKYRGSSSTTDNRV